MTPRILMVFTTLLIALQLNEILIHASSEGYGLLIVVTVPSIVKDVESIVCYSDRVVSLVPPGVDPHEYQLTPRDVATLKKADVIVSLGHTHFEIRIRELVERGDVKAKLIEIPYIPGIELMTNPMTGGINYHMPIYDPRNYVKFVTYLSRVLSSLNPSCAQVYRTRRDHVIELVEDLLMHAPKLNLTAVAANPMLQYAVAWLGIDVRYLVVREVGVPAIPSDIVRVREVLGREANVAVVMEPSDVASKFLESLAKQRGVPVIRVKAPYIADSVIDEIVNVYRQALNLSTKSLTTAVTCSGIEKRISVVPLPLFISTLIVGVAISVAILLRLVRR